MKSSYFVTAILIIGIAVLKANGLCAQAISTAALVFEYPMAVRSYGMGSTGVADDADPSNTIFNPANITSLSGIQNSVTYVDFPIDKAIRVQDNISLLAFNICGGYEFDVGWDNPFEFGAELLFGRLDYGESIARNVEGTEIGRFSSWETYFGGSIAGGTLLYNRLRVGTGVRFKYYHADFVPGDYGMQTLGGTGSTVAFDTGIRVATQIMEISDYVLNSAFGVSYLNLGPKVEFIDMEQSAGLPRNLCFGMSLKLTSPPTTLINAFFNNVPVTQLTVNADVILGSRGDDYDTKYEIYRFGAEASAFQILFLRIGYVDDNIRDSREITDGIGVGLKVGRFYGRFDYAKTPGGISIYSSGDDTTHSFGATAGFLF
jgi:hypothetical protein